MTTASTPSTPSTQTTSAFVITARRPCSAFAARRRRLRNRGAALVPPERSTTSTRRPLLAAWTAAANAVLSLPLTTRSTVRVTAPASPQRRKPLEGEYPVCCDLVLP